MKIAVLLFAYNRPIHTKKTIDALRDNHLSPEIIYVFQDACGDSNEISKWARTNEVIQQIDFCPVELIVSSTHNGLAKSLINGINHAFEYNDAVIVLEDDCVTDANFMGYMYDSLEQYRSNSEVYCINGYTHPGNYEECDADTFFAYRFWSWGWATWKDRWVQCRFDDDRLLSRIELNKSISERLALCGNDLRGMFLDRLKGKNDSWAIFWTLHIIEKGGVCLTPKVSLVKNIGCDGTGIHCGRSSFYDVELDQNAQPKHLSFPGSTKVMDYSTRAFIARYGGWTVINSDTRKKHISIYGLGTYFYINERIINEEYYIDEFIDRGRTGYYAGKEIKDLETYNRNSRVIITLLDMDESNKVKKMLIDKGTKAEDIMMLQIR